MNINIQDLLDGKVKLEFGNKEQIQAIDFYTVAQKEAEEGKKIYMVEIGLSGSVSVEVNANSEEEAEEIARDEFGPLEIDWDIEHVEAHLIQESPE